jgi:hypothetical protein
LSDSKQPHRLFDLVPQPVHETCAEVVLVHMIPKESKVLSQGLQLGSTAMVIDPWYNFRNWVSFAS